uniref:F-box domain-containing protein n=1 Tax=Mycena chlorophos TaxID=658473 RepID=A0ABQ0LXQ6_MYCCL|nr:predicted protein [Mycena chlorophos]
MDYLAAVPSELWTRIFESGSSADLRTLSLVCTRFCALSQPILFRHIDVVLPETQFGTAEQIRATCDEFIARFTGIAESPTLGVLVQSLRYADWLQQGNPMAMDEVTSFKRLVPRAFFPKLPLFVNIVTLTLWHVDIEMKVGMDVREAIDVLPRLRHLHIHRSRFPTGEVLPLESFTFSTHSEAGTFGKPLEIIDPHTIRKLVLHGADAVGVFLDALEGAELPVLRHLALHISSKHVGQAVALLDRSPALETLILDCLPLRGVSWNTLLGLPPARPPAPPALTPHQEQLMAPFLATIPVQQHELARQMMATMFPPAQEPDAPRPSVPMDDIAEKFTPSDNSLPNLHTVECPYTLTGILLRGRAIETLVLFRSESEYEEETALPAIEAAGVHAPNLKTLRLSTPILVSQIAKVLTAIAEHLPNLRSLAFTLKDPSDVPTWARHVRPEVLFSDLVERGKIALPAGHALQELVICPRMERTREGFDRVSAVYELLDLETQMKIVNTLGEREDGKALRRIVFPERAPSVGKMYARDELNGEWVSK